MDEISEELQGATNLKDAYNLIKKLKYELNKKEDLLSKDELNKMIDEVSVILQGNMQNIPKEDKGKLIISSEKQKVILPYTEEQIERYICFGKYETKEQVIENEYTLPLKKYKNEALSRVREGYKLAKRDKNLGYMERITYAINLISERRLHPAIITACNSIDELDIYLACLEENVLELFDFFEVVFEYTPLVV